MDLPRTNCPSPEEVLAALEGTLEAAEADSLRAHLEACDRCRGRTDEVEVLQTVARMLAKYQLSQRERERIERWKEIGGRTLRSSPQRPGAD